MYNGRKVTSDRDAISWAMFGFTAEDGSSMFLRSHVQRVSQSAALYSGASGVADDLAGNFYLKLLEITSRISLPLPSPACVLQTGV